MSPEEKKIALELAEKIQAEVRPLKDGVFVAKLSSQMNELIVASSRRTIGNDYSASQRDRDMGFVDGLTFVLSQIQFYSDVDLKVEDLQKDKK